MTTVSLFCASPTVLMRIELQHQLVWGPKRRTSGWDKARCEMSWSGLQERARVAVCSVLPVEVGMWEVTSEVSLALGGGLFGASTGGQR